MIALDLPDLLLLYLVFTLAALVSFWFKFTCKPRKHVALFHERRVNVCEYCYTRYAVQGQRAVTRCPACGSLNQNTPGISR